MIQKHQQNITAFIRKMYCDYFGVKMGDQGKSWAPHKVCMLCLCRGSVDLVEWKKESIHIWCPNDMEEAKISQC
jgi:hypothetical protein